MGEFAVLTFKVEASSGNTLYTKQPIYKRRACDRCVTRKIGCDGKQPCSKCHLANRPQCTYGSITRQAPKRRDQGSGPSTQTTAPSCTEFAPAVPLLAQINALATSTEPISNNPPPACRPPSWSGPSALPLTEPTVLMTRAPLPASLPLPPPHLTTACPPPVTLHQALPPLVSSEVPVPPTLPSLHQIVPHTTAGTRPLSPLITMAHSLSQSRLSLATIGQTYQNPALDTSESAPPILSWEHIQTFLSGIPVATFKSQFINMAHQITRLLKSAEDVIYNPVIVYSLIAVYVNQQVRIYQHCYLQRLYRKLRRHELSPLVLNFLLAYGAAIATESHRDMATRRAIAKVYLDRVKMGLEQEVAHPTLGTPHLISQIGTLHSVVQENEGFSYYITKGKGLMMEHHFHLVDSPVPTHHPLSGHLPNHSYPFTSQQAPQETALAQEFKRRTFWEIYTLDNQVNAMLGLPSSLSATQVTVQPIQDALLPTLFELPPEEDIYPALIPGIRHSLCGYPSLIELALLMGQVADLRAQRDLAPTTPSSHDSRLFMAYLDLGDQHQALAPRLLAEYPLPAYLPTPALVQSYPAYYSSLYTVHASFYAAGILLTIQNWNHGARAFRPNHHPTLYTRGLDLARQFDALIMPVLKILPFHYHTNVFGGTAYLMGYVFSQSLIPPPSPPTFSAPSAFTPTSANTRAAPLGIPWDPAAHLATRQLVHRYLRYLEGLAQHISYVQAYVTLLSRNLAEAEASYRRFLQPLPVVNGPAVVAIGPHAGKRICH